jgi:hypothetical protein
MAIPAFKAGDLVQTEDGLQAVVAFVTSSGMAYLTDGNNADSVVIGYRYVSSLTRVGGGEGGPPTSPTPCV